MPTITIYLDNKTLIKLTRQTEEGKTVAKKASEILKEQVNKTEA